MASQTEKLYNLLGDGEPHSTPQILREVYGSDHLAIARISARVYDLSRGKWSGKKKLKIESWRDPKHETIWYYRLVREEPEQVALFEIKSAYIPI